MAPIAPLFCAKQQPDLDNLCVVVVANRVEYAMQLCNRLVGGIVVARVGKAGLQLGLPVAPGNSTIQHDFCGGGINGKPVIKSHVKFACCV